MIPIIIGFLVIGIIIFYWLSNFDVAALFIVILMSWLIFELSLNVIP